MKPTLLEKIKNSKFIKDNEADYAISVELFKELSNTEYINLEHREIRMSNLTIGFVKFFLSKENFKKIYSNFLVDDKNSLRICLIKDGKLDVMTEFSKVDLINAMKKLASEDLLNGIELKRFSELKNLVLFDKYIDNNKGKLFYYNKRAFKVEDIINILSKSEEGFSYVIKKGALGLGRIGLVRMLHKYIFNTNITSKYFLSEDMYRNVSIIKGMDIRNYDEVELSDNHSYLNNINLNKEFLDYILSDIPANFDDFEKIFYIYYKLCNILVYDEEQMVNDNKGYGDYSINHTKLSRINKINQENNRVLCFEFNAIFAKVLELFNVRYELEGKEAYGKGHVGLRFIIDDLIVYADSTKHGVVYSDMAHAKNDIILDGFKLENSDDIESLNHFKKSLDKVYKYIEHERSVKLVSTEDRIKEYEKIVSNEVTLLDQDKLDLFIRKVNKCNLSITDKFEYYLFLQKAFFKDERLKLFFIRNNKPNDNIHNIMPTIVFVFKHYFNDRSYITRYFIQENNSLVEEVSLEYLKEEFNKYKYEYVGDRDDFIPGIKR